MPGDADADVSLPYVEGVAPLGPYSLEAQRRATRRTRTMTAVASVLLAGIVGAAALYLASPLGQRDDGMSDGAVAVAPSDAPEATDRTGAVSGLSTRLEPAAAAEMADEAPELEKRAQASEPEQEAEPPESENAAEPGGPEIEPELAEPEQEAEPPESENAAEPGGPEIEPEAAEPENAAEPRPVVVVTDESSRPAPTADALIAATAEPEPEAVGYDGSWVCNERIVIEDSRVRDWSLRRVSFRPRNGFERVVLHLERSGSGSGGPASLTASGMGSWKVKESIAGATRPGLGRRSVALDLDDGFSGPLALRGYRPTGLGIIKEFSAYPSGRDGRKVIISADTDGCYRVRVPAWNDPSASVRRAEIVVDIKP